ncbi:ciliary microtubule associated protein 1B-like [Drosophila nasuta]|uniref:ciliary microtubule associated protein 1B-like n=1 Tax=Drosophila nasuta TaxID=42062 RepID=UPI00295EC01D|nr:ciliary microtubule associated protein 1B-like [Drosophila nasuta]
MARPLGPGPGAYALPTTVGYEKHDTRKQRMPQYSFGTRTNVRGSGAGPGPGAYLVDKLTRYGKGGGLQYTIAPLTKILDKRVGPGPGAHDVHIFTGVTAPAYSMAPRNKYAFEKYGPGPSAYKYEVKSIKTAAPAYSMGIQTKTSKKADSPGPAAYGAGDLNIRLVRAPEYSMSPLHNIRKDSVGPGPNYYNLMYHRPGRSGNAYSFGVRHSPYAPPMVVKCDNM